MDAIFKEIIHLTERLKSDSDFLQTPPSDEIGVKINSSYLQDEANFNSTREFHLALSYFLNDFRRTNVAFLNSAEDLESIPLNKPEFFNSLNYTNCFSSLVGYMRRAILDYSATVRLECFNPKDKVFQKHSPRELSPLLRKMEEVVDCELSFPGLGLRVQNSLSSILGYIKNEEYESILPHKDETLELIQAKYASSSPGFLQLFDERFSEIIYLSQNS